MIGSSRGKERKKRNNIPVEALVLGDLGSATVEVSREAAMMEKLYLIGNDTRERERRREGRGWEGAR
jgi:hypothetical protein